MPLTSSKPSRSLLRGTRTRQTALWCSCGALKVAVRGLCAPCYARRQRDRAYFAGFLELVLARDGYRCQGCGRRGAGKRTLSVHHRRPGLSRERLLITLCRACHARVHRLQVVRRLLPALLLELWREQHPRGPEQLALDFAVLLAEALPLRLSA